MKQRPICCLCLLLMLGIVLLDRGEISLWRRSPVSVSVQDDLEQQPKVQVLGKVSKRTRSKTSTSVYLEQTKLIYHSNKYSLGNIRVFMKKETKLPIGAFVLLEGQIKRTELPRNPGEFNSRQYYAAQHISYLMFQGEAKKISSSYSKWGEALASLQEFLSGVLEKTAGEEAGIFCAMLLGDRSLLEEETKIRYQMAGILHILAISGLHLSLLGMGFYQGLKKLGLGNGGAGGIALAVIYQYGLLTGGSVATLRAVSMFLLAVVGKILGRTYDMLTAMAFAAILLLLDSPEYLYNSGFLLSFGAVLGMGVTAPVFLKKLPWKGKLSKALVSSLALQLTVLPVLLYFYYEVSLYGIVLNLAVLPTVAAVLISGLGGMLVGSLWPGIGQGLLWPGKILLKGYEVLCSLGCRLPCCTWVAGQPKLWQIFLYYGILFGVVWLWAHEEGRERRGLWKASGGVGILLLAGGILLLGVKGKSVFTITCLDVGQGDALVISVPSGETYLCDGGSSSKASVGSYQILPFLKSQGVSVLDGILVSHTDEDHISGIWEILNLQKEALTSVRVKALYLPKWEDKPEAYEALETAASKGGIPVFYLEQGNKLSKGEFSLEVLYPKMGEQGEDINENCLVFVGEYRNFRGIFTGDIGEATERKLGDLLKPCQFLKVGHHGSKNSTSLEFLEKLSPAIGVISCSQGNRYGHPSPETLQRLKEQGVAYWVTKDAGAITIRVQEEKVTVESVFSVKETTEEGAYFSGKESSDS